MLLYSDPDSGRSAVRLGRAGHVERGVAALIQQEAMGIASSIGQMRPHGIPENCP
jgi:hypothetical protein